MNEDDIPTRLGIEELNGHAPAPRVLGSFPPRYPKIFATQENP